MSMTPARCPHCGEPLDGHVCADTRRWTQAERDEWRRIARRRDPAASFFPTYIMDRFGERNRKDREREG